MNSESNNLSSSVPEQIAAICAEAERIEEDATYSSTGHFEASKPWAKVNLWIGIPVALIATTSGLASELGIPLLASAAAFGAAAGAALLTFLSPQEKQKLHAACGNAYAILRNDARIFLRIECSSGKPVSDLRAQLEALAQRRNSLNESSPIIPERAFRRAQQSIRDGEKSHRVDMRTTRA